MKVKRADVQGETHNDLFASEHLIVRASGRIHGKSTYVLIEIERGGVIHGVVIPVQQGDDVTFKDHHPVLLGGVTTAEPQKAIEDVV